MEKETPNLQEIYDAMPLIQRDELERLHNAATNVLIMIDAIASFREGHHDDSSDVARKALRALNAGLEQLELKMQDVYGVQQDPNHHSWWLKPHACTCSKKDNADAMVFGRAKLIDRHCPVHGNN